MQQVTDSHELRQIWRILGTAIRILSVALSYEKTETPWKKAWEQKTHLILEKNTLYMGKQNTVEKNHLLREQTPHLILEQNPTLYGKTNPPYMGKIIPSMGTKTPSYIGTKPHPIWENKPTLYEKKTTSMGTKTPSYIGTKPHRGNKNPILDWNKTPPFIWENRNTVEKNHLLWEQQPYLRLE